MTLRALVQSRHIGFPRGMGLEHMPPSWEDWLKLEIVRVHVPMYFRKRRIRHTFFVIPDTTVAVWVGPQSWMFEASGWLFCDDALLINALCDAWKIKSGEWTTADFKLAADGMIARIPCFPKRPILPAEDTRTSMTSELDLV